ncbi:MAG: stage II sporulation protein R [Oscillospiraceae bacterium]|nr:stage II sporulation protein R [Oscillospiraceae bacterium]
MKNILRILILSLGIAAFTAFGAFRTFSASCEEVRGEVLRLHIPANSDSDEDQAVKLRLRDALLERFGGELSDCGDLAAATERAVALLPEIERFANEFLAENGFSYGAKAELVEMYFTTREYERLILPAGQYTALRVTLGSGAGKNWWCVIFPQLCLPAASEHEISEQKNAGQVLEAFGKPQKITPKFAVYEWLLGASG